MKRQESPQPLVDFFRGAGTDHRGRRVTDLHRFDHGQLESVHDYIQWLFPLRERSLYNLLAPTLDEPQIAAIRSSPELQQVVRRGFEVMLGFYGLSRTKENDRVTISRSSDFPSRAQNWITSRNHNFLRITRILTSLRLLGLEDEARAFFECLQVIYREHAKTISAATFGYWENAMRPALET
jgi:hypothetical protein